MGRELVPCLVDLPAFSLYRAEVAYVYGVLVVFTVEIGHGCRDNGRGPENPTNSGQQVMIAK